MIIRLCIGKNKLRSWRLVISHGLDEVDVDLDVDIWSIEVDLNSC